MAVAPFLLIALLSVGVGARPITQHVLDAASETLAHENNPAAEHEDTLAVADRDEKLLPPR